MDALLVTPASEADLHLLTSLFKKMKIKSELVPAPAASARRANRAAPPITEEQRLNPLLPRTQAERNLVEAIEEMKEVMAGRKQAMSLQQFLDELK